MPITAERGYIIPAIDSESTMYVDCATQLAGSIKKFHPGANITIVTKDMLPNGDQGGFANDWQMSLISPYRQTIKLEADMLCASPFDHWWTMFEHRDMVISTGARDFYNNQCTSRFYRRLFDDNNLPDVYNAITYWRVSQTAKDFFTLVRAIFENWGTYRTLLKSAPTTPDTDVVYAIAAVIVGIENVTLPDNVGPQIVHMKRYMNPIVGSDWTRELVWESDSNVLRINTIAQNGMFHYYNKDWRVNE